MGPSAHQNYLTNWYQGILNDPLGGEMAKRIMDMESTGQIDKYRKEIAGASRNAESTGAYGSSGLVNQQGQNAGRLGEGLQNAQTMAAMQLMDRGLNASGQVTSLQGNLDSANASMSNARTAAGASMSNNRYSTDAQRQSQMAQLALQAAMGQQGYMGDMASLFSGDQRSAAGMIPGYHDVQMNDLSRAFGGSMQFDQMNNQAASQRAAAARAQSNAQWSRQMQMAQAPQNNWDWAANGITGLTPYMGERYTNNTSPGTPMGAQANPFGMALGTGANTYGEMMRLFGGGQQG